MFWRPDLTTEETFELIQSFVKGRIDGAFFKMSPKQMAEYFNDCLRRFPRPEFTDLIEIVVFVKMEDGREYKPSRFLRVCIDHIRKSNVTQLMAWLASGVDRIQREIDGES
jgi:hypothetical protein